MAKIEKVWFNNERIYLLTDSGETLSRPLEAFPVLKEASEADRNDFKIGRFGDQRLYLKNYQNPNKKATINYRITYIRLCRLLLQRRKLPL